MYNSHLQKHVYIRFASMESVSEQIADRLKPRGQDNMQMVTDSITNVHYITAPN